MGLSLQVIDFYAGPTVEQQLYMSYVDNDGLLWSPPSPFSRSASLGARVHKKTYLVFGEHEHGVPHCKMWGQDGMVFVTLRIYTLNLAYIYTEFLKYRDIFCIRISDAQESS